MKKALFFIHLALLLNLTFLDRNELLLGKTNDVLAFNEKGEKFFTLIHKMLNNQIIKNDALIRSSKELVLFDTLPPLTMQVDTIFQVVEDFSFIPNRPECARLSDSLAKKDCFEKVLMDRIYKNLEYPELAKEHNIEGTVLLTVVFDNDNKIYCVRILRDIGAQAGKAALTAMNQSLKELLIDYRPCKWKPRKSRGQPVKVAWNIPVKFKLEQKD